MNFTLQIRKVFNWIKSLLFMNQTQGKVQLGKNGVTENFIISLQGLFKKNGNVRISILKNAGHKKEKVNEYKEKILSGLGNHYTAKIIGFTIVVKKWRKARV